MSKDVKLVALKITAREKGRLLRQKHRKVSNKTQKSGTLQKGNNYHEERV